MYANFTMITSRLKYLFLISIPVFIAHGLEEYFTGFYDIDQLDQIVFSPLAAMSTHQATFAMFQIMFWILLIVSFLLIFKYERWRLYLITFLGLIFIFELHHLYKAVAVGGYYPGLISALAFPVLGFFWWKELLKNFSHQ